LFEARHEAVANLLVPLGEIRYDGVQERADSVFREGHDASDDPGDSLRTARAEGPQKHAGLVGLEDGSDAFDVD
jgi:hypothetical protein